MFGSVRKMIALFWLLSSQGPQINYSAKKVKCKEHICLNQPRGAKTDNQCESKIKIVKSMGKLSLHTH